MRIYREVVEGHLNHILDMLKGDTDRGAIIHYLEGIDRDTLFEGDLFLSEPVYSLTDNVRLLGVLEREQIKVVKDIYRYGQAAWLRAPNMGVKTFKVLQKALKDKGYPPIRKRPSSL